MFRGTNFLDHFAYKCSFDSFSTFAPQNTALGRPADRPSVRVDQKAIAGVEGLHARVHVQGDGRRRRSIRPGGNHASDGARAAAVSEYTAAATWQEP